MVKAKHARYRNLTVITAWGPIVIDAEGNAELPEGAADTLLNGPFGWSSTEAPVAPPEALTPDELETEEEVEEEAEEEPVEEAAVSEAPVMRKKKKKKKLRMGRE